MRGWAELSIPYRRFGNRAVIKNRSLFAPQKRLLERLYDITLSFGYEHPEAAAIVQRTGRPYDFEVIHFPTDEEEPTIVLGRSLTGIVAAEAVDNFTPAATMGLLGILTAITLLEADAEYSSATLGLRSSAELTAAAEYVVRRNFGMPAEVDAFNAEWIALQCARSGIADLSAYQTVAYLSAIVGATNPIEGACIRKTIARSG